MSLSLATTTAEHGSSSAGEKNIEPFFDEWKQKQKQLLEDMIQLSQRNPTETEARCMVDSVVQLHDDYYKIKSECAHKNTLLVLNPSWTTSLEETYMWIGGWRPTNAIHFLYSESGIQLEAKLGQWLQGITTPGPPDLGDLTPGQVSQVDELHKRLLVEENELSEKHAKVQHQTTDPDVVGLSQEVGDAMRAEEKGLGVRDREAENERVESILIPKEEKLRVILEKADKMRLRTLKSIIQILCPEQAMHFMIAATELQLRMHDWGMDRDGRRQNNS